MSHPYHTLQGPGTIAEEVVERMGRNALKCCHYIHELTPAVIACIILGLSTCHHVEEGKKT